MSTRNAFKWLYLVWGQLILAGCSLSARSTPQYVPVTEMLPTWIAQTVQAGQAGQQATQIAKNPDIPKTTITPTPSNPTSTATPQLSIMQLTSTEANPATLTPTPLLGINELQPSSTPQLGTPRLSTTEAQLTLTSTPNSRPTRTPTVTPTLAIPDAAIQIREPGPLSRIVTPLRVVAWVKPGGDGRVRIELFGEDGRLLVRKLLLYGTDDHRYFLNETLDFEIPGVAETARLQLSTYDTYGRQTALASQDLILLSIGESQLNPPGKLDEPVIILEPRPNKLIQGGTVLISGQALPLNDQALLVELIARDGHVVGYRQAFVPPSPEGNYVPFLAEVPYQVQAVTSARLTIKAYSSGRIPGIIYITSQEILLSP